MHDKDKPLAPRKGLMDTHYCPLCDTYLANRGGYIKRCPVCGQRIDWEGEGKCQVDSENANRVSDLLKIGATRKKKG